MQQAGAPDSKKVREFRPDGADRASANRRNARRRSAAAAIGDEPQRATAERAAMLLAELTAYLRQRIINGPTAVFFTRSPLY